MATLSNSAVLEDKSQIHFACFYEKTKLRGAGWGFLPIFFFFFKIGISIADKFRGY